jgi:hypothetical protein
MLLLALCLWLGSGVLTFVLGWLILIQQTRGAKHAARSAPEHHGTMWLLHRLARQGPMLVRR